MSNNDFKTKLMLIANLLKYNYKLVYIDISAPHMHYSAYTRRSSEHFNFWKSQYDTFKLPPQMDENDAFLVLSFLVEKIEAIYNLKPCDPKGVRLLNEIIEEFGFIKDDSEYAKPLYTISYKGYNNLKNALKGANINDYFEWFTPGVTIETVEEIYEKYNLSCDCLRKNSVNIFKMK